jgi:hypothetical protein
MIAALPWTTNDRAGGPHSAIRATMTQDSIVAYS